MFFIFGKYSVLSQFSNVNKALSTGNPCRLDISKLLIMV